jgi:hypothetical protein
MFRDPRYLAPLGVLLGVIFVAAIAAETGSGRTVASAVPTATVATAQTAASPTAAATPDAGAADAGRMRDLVRVRDAMISYRQAHGKFPLTKNGMTTLCASSSDPGCVLAPAPFGDGNEAYWFASDGNRVSLVARGDIGLNSAQCPSTLPAALTGVPLVCLEFERQTP